MSDTKILQSILDSVRSVDNKVTEVKNELKNVETRLTTRIDKLGLQIANLEDDTPTIKEFDNLDKRVRRVEKQITSV